MSATPTVAPTVVPTTSVAPAAQTLHANLARVMVGQNATIELLLVALFTNGHVLLEDVPGLGKTTLAKTLARSLGGLFQRVQFTPDLLPSDMTGVSVFNPKTADFEFRPGPLFAQIVLADEINRAGPRTQSALLEAMEERQITVDGVTRPLPRPFLVIATQNPIELEGTFPLPEAQLDRFLLRLSLGYPSMQQEINVLELQQRAHPIESLQQVVTVEALVAAQRAAREVYAEPALKHYLVEIVAQTRKHPDVYLGASPRGSLALFRACQARAAMQGRDYILPDDVKALAEPALAHRVIIGPAARIKEVTARTVIRDILHTLPVPGTSALKK